MTIHSDDERKRGYNDERKRETTLVPPPWPISTARFPARQCTRAKARYSV